MKKLFFIKLLLVILFLLVGFSIFRNQRNQVYAGCCCDEWCIDNGPRCCDPPEPPMPTNAPAWCDKGCAGPQPPSSCCDTCTGTWGSCGGGGTDPGLQCKNFAWDGLNTISGQAGRWQRHNETCLEDKEEVDCTNGGLITRCVNWSAPCGYCTIAQLYFRDVDTGQISQKIGSLTGCYDNNDQDLRNCIDPPIHSGLTPFSYNTAQIMPTVFPQIVNDGQEHHLQLYAGPTTDSYICGGANSVICGYFTYAAVPPTPTPYPNIVITGALEQNSGGSCYSAGGGNTFTSPNISVSSNPNLCVTPSCAALPVPGTAAVGYSCTIKVANQGCPTPPTPALTLNLSASTTGYGAGQWAAPPSGGACSPASTQLAVNAASGPYTVSKDIVFPFTGTNWIKLKDASFTATSTNTISLPLFINKFTPEDSDDDASQKYFIMTTSANGAEAGAVTGATVGPAPNSYSNTHNWSVNPYSRTVNLNATDFLSYIQSRKDYQRITAADFSEIAADGLYVWGGTSPLTINSLPAAFNAYNVVLVSSGEIDISVAQFKPTKSVAVIANALTFLPAVTEATGIFVGNSVDTGATTNQGLKITGNLTAKTFTNGRSWTDTSRPSIFVVFDPKPFLDLLPYLSTAKYDWQQLQ